MICEYCGHKGAPGDQVDTMVGKVPACVNVLLCMGRIKETVKPANKKNKGSNK
jgi:hypothetical protein